MRLTSKSVSGLFLLFACNTAAQAEYYPAQYQITDAGFNRAIPLQKKLSTTQGELFFKETGIYIGASDVAYQDKVASEDYYEIDTYAGIKKKIGLFGYHLGFKSYNRAINKDLEVQELYVGANIKDLSFSYATNDEGEYKQINLTHEISSVNIGVHLGETKTQFGQAYADWSIHASRKYKTYMFNAIMTKSDNPLYNATEFNLGLEKALTLF